MSKSAGSAANTGLGLATTLMNQAIREIGIGLWELNWRNRAAQCGYCLSSKVDFGSCVDGSGLAREIFTSQAWSVLPCVRPRGVGSHDRWP